MSIGEGEYGGGVGGDEVYNGRAKLVLVSLSDSYSEDDAISVGDNWYSSYPAYTVY